MYEGLVKCTRGNACNSDFWFSFFHKGAVTGPWILEMDKVCVFPGKFGSSLAQWMNRFWVVEFCLFPSKDNHL